MLRATMISVQLRLCQKQNATNPELLLFYQEVWLPLLNTDSKLRQTPQIPTTIDTSAALLDTDGDLAMNVSSPISSTSGNNGTSPDPINTTPSVPAEKLR